MANVIVELLGVFSILLGFIVLNFLLIIYVSIRRQGGQLEKRHVIVISSVAIIFFLAGILIYALGTL